MKTNSMNVMDELSREELKKIMAGSGSPGGGGGQQCNCLYCSWIDGGITTFAASCATNPPNPMTSCAFLGWPRVPISANYGIC